jgi:hypothetical protein
MIGHQVLLNSNDSTSRVLPIVKEKDSYRIQFDSEFEFVPEELVATFNQVVKETKIAAGYIVEVVKCGTNEVVYSFEKNELEQTDITPCLGRSQPKSCYNLLFTLLDSGKRKAVLPPFNPGSSDNSNSKSPLAIFLNIILVIGLMVGLFFLFRNRKKESTTDPNVIHLGDYQFDKRSTELIIEGQRVELTAKESDLLLLLYEAVNTTVERDVILNKVWGDEGDYVGRTLDVFISKLRKKLGGGSGVKIVNIRGVGYKLVMS